MTLENHEEEENLTASQFFKRSKGKKNLSETERVKHLFFAVLWLIVFVFLAYAIIFKASVRNSYILGAIWGFGLIWSIYRDFKGFLTGEMTIYKDPSSEETKAQKFYTKSGTPAKLILKTLVLGLIYAGCLAIIGYMLYLNNDWDQGILFGFVFNIVGGLIHPFLSGLFDTKKKSEEESSEEKAEKSKIHRIEKFITYTRQIPIEFYTHGEIPKCGTCSDALFETKSVLCNTCKKLVCYECVPNVFRKEEEFFSASCPYCHKEKSLEIIFPVEQNDGITLFKVVPDQGTLILFGLGLVLLLVNIIWGFEDPNYIILSCIILWNITWLYAILRPILKHKFPPKTKIHFYSIMDATLFFLWIIVAFDALMIFVFTISSNITVRIFLITFSIGWNLLAFYGMKHIALDEVRNSYEFIRTKDSTFGMTKRKTTEETDFKPVQSRIRSRTGYYAKVREQNREKMTPYFKIILIVTLIGIDATIFSLIINDLTGLVARLIAGFFSALCTIFIIWITYMIIKGKLYHASPYHIRDEHASRYWN
ncbi:hypothetical protein [Candidatus Lokiarchaeum ossiferum]|uniref:hypothetical protein n=1 Tax=Candidatus Lokiarchaeum ossiferum TaxID=2951803 RepID=UPI00352F1FCE